MASTKFNIGTVALIGRRKPERESEILCVASSNLAGATKFLGLLDEGDEFNIIELICMTSRYCKGCGNKIPRKILHTDKKTSKSRKYCFNCSPVKSPKNNYSKSNNSERRRRKEVLVKMLGGRCVSCGYNKSITALSFHHKCPQDKSFDISSNGCLMHDWDVVVQEARKCELLCLNCHAEYHNEK